MDQNSSFKKRKLLGLLKNSETIDSHAILKEPKIEEEPQIVEENFSLPPTTSVWPLEDNLIINEVNYSENSLFVNVTNLFLEPLDIISMGVKYTSYDTENIDFVEKRITLPPGEKTILIPCPKGKPFKFVIRTANGTGTGNTQNSLEW